MKKLLFVLMLVFSMTISTVNISAASKKEKIIYLTFDDGPSKYTPQVLKVLDKYKVKATFFVTGQNPKYFSYIKTASKKGHAIGLHTYTHKYSIYKSTSTYFKDLDKIQALVKKQTGKKSSIIRFPGGSSNTISRKYKKKIMTTLSKQVKKKGYQYFDWNVSSGDGGSGLSVKKIIKNSTSSKANTIVLLMHDANGKQNSVKALPTIIEHYKKKGYKFKVLTKNSYAAHHHINN